MHTIRKCISKIPCGLVRNYAIFKRPSTINFKPPLICSFIKTDSKNGHRGSSQFPKTPELIYMPHIIRWVKSKLRIKYLKRIWDPEFSEGAFIYGTTRAVCRITEIINSGQTDELKQLMTISAYIKLTDDMAYRLTKDQKEVIVLRPEDIKILVPINVAFVKDGFEKICRIGLRVLALKWHKQKPNSCKLVLVALQSEFSRDYSTVPAKDWTISNFSVLECALLSEAKETSR